MKETNYRIAICACFLQAAICVVAGVLLFVVTPVGGTVVAAHKDAAEYAVGQLNEAVEDAQDFADGVCNSVNGFIARKEREYKEYVARRVYEMFKEDLKKFLSGND